MTQAGPRFAARPGPQFDSRFHEALAGKIRQVHEQNRRVYGSPRVCRVLAAQGESVCENTVADIMKERQIRAKRKPKFVPRTTDSRHGQPVADNLLDRQFDAPLPNQKWHRSRLRTGLPAAQPLS